jgi:ribulose-5-phosphate 4-epimerase/fuculose-1-phosphate aldolase
MKSTRLFFGLASLTLLVAFCTSARAQLVLTNPSNLPDAIAEFVVANRILADQKVIEDGFGHLSFRSPTDPKRFYMARARGAGMVTAEDVMEFDADGNPIDEQGRRTFVERFIHAEIYKARPDVQAVVHSHAPSVVPFSITSKPLRPVVHTAGFLLHAVPVFEIRDVGGNETNMLVSNNLLGAALAKSLGSEAVVLMRGHGMSAVGASMKQAVFRAIYTDVDARIQAEAQKMGEVTALSDAEAAKISATLDSLIERSWEIWKYKALINTPKL